MSYITWITPAGLIAQLAEESYFEFQLDAYDSSGSALTYSIIAGELSNGLQLFKSGLIQGIPVIEKETAAEEYKQTFTIRAKNIKGKISDRTFSIVVNSIVLPQIIPKDVSLGTVYDGYHWVYQLTAVDPSPLAVLKWKLIDGELPNGITLTTDGLLTGYILPFTNPGDLAILGWDLAGWDRIIWDTPTAEAQSKNYRFTVQVNDGTRYDESTYTLNVQAKKLFTVDNSEIGVNTTALTSDIDDNHAPIITTLPQTLPIQRQNSNFAFKVDGLDIDGEDIMFGLHVLNSAYFDQGPTTDNPIIEVAAFDAFAFDQIGQTLPNGIVLDPHTGWLTGNIPAQAEVEKTFTFQIYCYKTDHPSYVSIPVTFNLTVLGDMNNVIDWHTPSDLGTITNGTVSELSIQATARKPNKLLRFILTPGIPDRPDINPSLEVIRYTPPVYSKLPQGLKLLDDGMIIGRASFDYFSLDANQTTFDKNKTNFDNVYTFSVTATDATIFELDSGTTTIDQNLTIFDALYPSDIVPGATVKKYAATVIDTKVFTLRVNNYNKTPFENLYLRALPDVPRRLLFNSILENQDYFPTELIYRMDDPFFGKAKDIKFLFAAGLAPHMVRSYVESMQQNHYTKRLELGQIKTAVALDENFQIKYEIVYIDVVDTSVVNSSAAPNITHSTVQPFTTIMPNALDNLHSEVTAIGYSNRGALPKWMTNQQLDGRVLGFTRAVILAYTVPGASKLMAFRLQQEKINFGNLDFVVDRYQLDNYMTTNFNLSTNKFVKSVETTFDRSPPTGELYPYAGVVDFAVTAPFDEINGRTVEYLLRSGGLDGSSNIVDGLRIVFAKQEQYTLRPLDEIAYTKDVFDSNVFDSIGFNQAIIPREYNSPNDGWNDNRGLYGTLIYGVTPYANTSVIPGFLEKLVAGDINKRAGIWQLHITDENVVELEFISEIEINQYVQVADGNSFRHTKIYYDPLIKPGYTVPQYSILTDTTYNASETTRFDGNATRFYSNRDMYAGPETNNKWVKFPKINMFE